MPSLRQALRETRAGELRHRRGGARRLAAVEQVGGAQREKTRRRELSAEGGDARPRGVEPVGVAQPAFDLVEDPGEAAELLGRDPLEVERVHDDVPAAVELADEVLRGNLDAVEEDLAEEAAAEHREPAHLDPRACRAVRRRRISRDAAARPGSCARRGRSSRRATRSTSRSCGRRRRTGRPRACARRQRREIASRLRLGESLAEGELATRDRPEQPLLERGRREALERAADGLVREQVERERQPVVAEGVLDERRVDVRQAAAAALLRPREADEPCLAERARDLARVAVGEETLAAPLGIVGERRAQARRERRRLVPQRDLRVCQPEIHARAIVECARDGAPARLDRDGGRHAARGAPLPPGRAARLR